MNGWMDGGREGGPRQRVRAFCLSSQFACPSAGTFTSHKNWKASTSQTMKTTAAFLALAGSAAAFAPSSNNNKVRMCHPASRHLLRIANPLCSPLFLASIDSLQAPLTTVEVANLSELPGSTAPFKAGFDPIKLSDIGSDETFAWMQAA